MLQRVPILSYPPRKVITLVALALAAALLLCWSTRESHASQSDFTQPFHVPAVLRSAASRASVDGSRARFDTTRAAVPLFLELADVQSCAATHAWEPFAPRATAVVNGSRPLHVAVVVLSCASDACAADRARLRATVYNSSTWWAGESVYCGGSADSNVVRRLSRAQLHREVRIRHVFVVGEDAHRAEVAVRIRAEQAAHADVVVLPSGDAYSNLHEKVLHALLWLHCVSRMDYDMVFKTDSDSYVRVPQLGWALHRLLHSAVDPASPARYTDLLWGSHMRAWRREPIEASFVGGLGYAMSRGLVSSIVLQMLAGPLDTARSTGGIANIFGSAEDFGMSTLVLTRPHVALNDRVRLHDILSASADSPGVNKARVQPSTLVAHRGAHSGALSELQAYFRAVDVDGTCVPPHLPDGQHVLWDSRAA